MSAYPESFIFEVYISGSWVDITSDVIEEQEAQRGILSNSQTDRVASTGYLKFTLNNEGGKYTPSLPTALSGWSVGIQFRMKVIYETVEYVKFYGHISNIEVDTTLRYRKVKVIALDWIDYAATNPVELSTEYNKKVTDAVPTILASMPVQPLDTTYHTASDTFATVFDDVKSNSRALSEFGKLALSEYGYIYLRLPEQLIVEGRQTRGANSELAILPVSAIAASRMGTESEDYIMTESNDYLVLDEKQELNFYDNMMNREVSYGETFVNRVVMVSHPRRIDTGYQVLFSISNPITLTAGEIKSAVRASYRDPASLSTKVNAIDMQTPIQTTDYQMWSNSDGTGTNLSGSLVVGVTYYSNYAEYTIQNTSAVTGYVTKLQFRGLGIYTYDDITYTTSASDSINAYGYKELKVDQKYQSSSYSNTGLANTLLNQNKTPKLNLNSISFLANYSAELMMSFLYFDIGDLIRVKVSKDGIDSYFYIQGIKYKIKQGGIITYTWLLAEALSLNDSFWELGVPGKSELGVTTILSY